MTSLKKPAIWIASLLALTSVCGIIWPGRWWGVDALAFLPFGAGIGLLVLVGLLIVYPKWVDRVALKEGPIDLWKYLPYVLGVAGAVVCYTWPIAADYYGNARTYIPLLDQRVSELPGSFWTNFFSLEFEPGNGRNGVFQVVTLLAHYTGETYGDAFKLLGALCGAGFIVLWSRLIIANVQSSAWRLSLILMGLFSGAMLVFFGHIESYSLVFLITLGWAAMVLRYSRTNSTRDLILIGLILLVGIRFHTLTYLLVIPSLLLVVRRFWSGSVVAHRLSSFRGVSTWVIAPVFVCGLLAYFFIFGDHNDPRTLTDFRDIDRLFLPIVSPDPPLDNYNLLSLNHVSDFLNTILFWSPLLVFVTVWCAGRLRKLGGMDRIEVRVIGTGFIFLTAMLFMINPLFSMPMDWDLFCFPAVLLMVLVVLGAKRLEDSGVKAPLGSIAPMWLLSIPMFLVFTSTKAQLVRVGEIGQHVYHTYYEHSATYLLFSLSEAPNAESYARSKQHMIQELKPYALKGRDKQFADLLIDDGVMQLSYFLDTAKAVALLEEALVYYPESTLAQSILSGLGRKEPTPSLPDSPGPESDEELIETALQKMRQEGDVQEALRLFRQAAIITPINPARTLFEMEAYFRIEQYDTAYVRAQELVEFGYPDRLKSLRAIIHVGLEAGEYDGVLEYASEYLELSPDDATIRTVSKRLSARDRVDELKNMFRQQ